MATKHITDAQVCQAVLDARACQFTRNNEECWPYTLLMERTGQPFKVCYRALERAAYKHNLLEYGVSLRTAWLNEKGQILLASCIMKEQKVTQ